MKKTIEVYDDLIDDETHAKVYEWCQSVSWYTRWLGLQDVKGKQFKPINEYIPSEDGNYNTIELDFTYLQTLKANSA